MPHRNRVDPFGDLVADPARGTLYGNRGVLHAAWRPDPVSASELDAALHTKRLTP